MKNSPPHIASHDLPNVLFVGANDWANLSHGFARAINAFAGAPRARVYTANTHPYGYELDLVGAAGWDELKSLAPHAQWIVSTGDGDYDAFFNLLSKLPLAPGVRFATAHCGTAYRNAPQAYNTLDDDLDFELRFIGQDLYRFTNANARVLPMIGSTDRIRTPAPKRREGPLRIAHSPSNRHTKGTDEILRVLDAFKARVVIDLIEGVDFQTCLARRAEADIFIDQMVQTIGGWGQSAIEAMGQGCAVLCDFHNVDDAVYGFYPKPPLIQVGTPTELTLALETLLSDEKHLLQARQTTWKWAQDHASPHAVGRYWAKAFMMADTLQNTEPNDASTQGAECLAES